MNFIKFPFFMRNKKKKEILNTMISKIEENSKKKYCDDCKRKFLKSDSRWSYDFESSICILCHKKHFKKKIKDYMPYEQKEIRKLKESSSKTSKENNKC